MCKNIKSFIFHLNISKCLSWWRHLEFFLVFQDVSTLIWKGSSVVNIGGGECDYSQPWSHSPPPMFRTEEVLHESWNILKKKLKHSTEALKTNSTWMTENLHKHIHLDMCCQGFAKHSQYFYSHSTKDPILKMGW